MQSRSCTTLQLHAWRWPDAQGDDGGPGLPRGRATLGDGTTLRLGDPDSGLAGAPQPYREHVRSDQRLPQGRNPRRPARQGHSVPPRARCNGQVIGRAGRSAGKGAGLGPGIAVAILGRVSLCRGRATRRGGRCRGQAHATKVDWHNRHGPAPKVRRFWHQCVSLSLCHCDPSPKQGTEIQPPKRIRRSTGIARNS
jgi:hypothetical protein